MANGWSPMVKDKCIIKDGRWPGRIDEVNPNRGTRCYHVRYTVTMNGLGQSVTGENSGWFSRSQLEKRPS